MFQPLPKQFYPALRGFYERFSKRMNDEIWEKIGPLHQYLEVKKGEKILSQGEICNWFGLVVSGVFRFYFLKENKEVVGDIFLKGQMASSFASYISSQPSRIFLDAVEDGSLIIITKESEKKIADILPDYFRVTKLTRDLVYVRSYERYVMHLLGDAEQRYLNLMEKKPELLQSVPLYMIASYIGITPEALSHIRKKLADKS